MHAERVEHGVPAAEALRRLRLGRRPLLHVLVAVGRAPHCTFHISRKTLHRGQAAALTAPTQTDRSRKQDDVSQPGVDVAAIK